MTTVSLDVTLSMQRGLTSTMETLMNNAANAGVHGFQTDDVIFSEFLGQRTNLETISYLNDVATVRDLRNGSLDTTGNPLHVALQSGGYFGIETPNGIRYTRSGAFTVNPQGVLIDLQGDPVLSSDGGQIAIPAESTTITIGVDGSIADENGLIAQLGVFSFENEYDIRKTGNTQFETEQAVIPFNDQANIVQGALENANVNIIKNMSKMMQVSKTYSLNQRYIEEQLKLEQKKIDSLAQSAPAA